MISSFNTLPTPTCGVGENDGILNIEKQPPGSRTPPSHTLRVGAFRGLDRRQLRRFRQKSKSGELRP